MGYRIEYPSPAPKWKHRELSWKQRCLTALLLLALLFSALIPAGRRIWMDMLIPGEDSVTQAAISNLVDEMRQGENLEEVFFAFCKGMFYESA